MMWVRILSLVVLFYFQSSAAWAQRSSETIIGPLSFVEREFDLSIEECGRNYKKINAYIGECNIRVGQERVARLARSSTIIHIWNYDSGDKWKLDVSILFTSQGYKIRVAGEPPMPHDRTTWAVAEKYIRRAIEEYGSTKAKAAFLRPESQILTDEKIIGPMYMFERTLSFNAINDYFTMCESRLKKIGAKYTCNLGLISQNSNEAVLNNIIHRASSELKSGEKVKLLFTTIWGWQYSGSFSTANFIVEYNGKEISAEKRRALFTQVMKTKAWPTVGLIVHRPTATPKKSKLFTEKRLGRVQLVLRQFDLDMAACQKSWRNGNGQAECVMPLNFRGMRLSESIYPFSGEVKIGSQGAYVDFVFAQGEMQVRIYGTDKIVSEFTTAAPFLRKASSTFPNELISDLAMIW